MAPGNDLRTLLLSIPIRIERTGHTVAQLTLPPSDGDVKGWSVVSRDAILNYCDERLSATDFQDVAVNGLQVSGSQDIARLAVAVSTSAQTIDAAANWGADALLVHHGLLWGSRLQPLVGVLAERLRLLFQHDINLIAYHLPLDAHEEIGNCALLADRVGYQPTGRFASIGGQPLGVIGTRDDDITLPDLLATLQRELDRVPTTVGDVNLDSPISRVGFLTGSGYSAVEEARQLGCQALVTGDVREPTMAEARELGISVIAAGHEATERFGVQALANEIHQKFGIETRFFPDPNPV